MDENKRKCIACNLIKPRQELIKITYNSFLQEIKINPDSKFFGRSAYICKDVNCVEKALKKEKIFKLLKTKSDETLKEKIRTVLED